MKEFLESKHFLKTVAEEAERNSDTARQLFAGLNEQQLNWTFDPKKWSIAQCLDHLTTTSRQFDSYFTPAIARGRQKWPVSEPIPYRASLVGGWLAKFVNPESMRKFPAPKVFMPAQSDIHGALESFLTQQFEFLNFVRQAEGVDYNKVRIRSPVTPFMRYSLADAFVVTVFHGRRHLDQAKRMRDTEGFPG